MAADPNKARDIAGIRKRSIKRYGKGSMQSQRNLEATYERTHPKAKAKKPAGTAAGQHRPTTQPNQRPANGPGVIPLRKPTPKPKPAPQPVAGTGKASGQRAPIDYGKVIPGPSRQPGVIPLRGPGPSKPKVPAQGGGQIGSVSGGGTQGGSFATYAGQTLKGKPTKPKKGIR